MASVRGLGTLAQLEPDRFVGAGEEDQQPEVVERKAASFSVVVFRAERLVTFASVGEIVENHLPDLAALLHRERGLHAHRLAGDMVHDCGRQCARLDRRALHDEIDCAQRQVLHVETIGDFRIVPEDHAALE